MAECKGPKTYHGYTPVRSGAGYAPVPYYTQEYVDWLQQRIEALTKSNQTLRKQLQALKRSAAKNYSDQSDYLPYPEEDYR